MINVHLSYKNLSDLDLPNVKLAFPEHGMHHLTHSQLVPVIMDLQNLGEVNLITWSGGLFWGLAEQIALEKILLKDLVIYYYPLDLPVRKSNLIEKPVIIGELSCYLDFSMSVPPDVLVGGEIEKHRIFQYLEIGKTDRSAKKVK